MLGKSNRFNASCNVEATSNAGAFKLSIERRLQSGYGMSVDADEGGHLLGPKVAEEHEAE
jgi:hypothetical protein